MKKYFAGMVDNKLPDSSGNVTINAYTHDKKTYTASQLAQIQKNLSTAKSDGYYQGLYAGGCDNLVDRKTAGINRSFSLDTSCGSASITNDGNASVKAIYGNTHVYNQMVQNTETITLDSTHKYLFRDNGVDSILSGETSVSVVSGEDYLIDLTRMYGANHEPATASALYKDYPLLKGSMSYNAGSLVSYNGTGIKSVGFNQWDKSTATGTVVFDDKTCYKLAETSTAGRTLIADGDNLSFGAVCISGKAYKTSSVALRVFFEYADGSVAAHARATTQGEWTSFSAVSPSSKQLKAIKLGNFSGGESNAVYVDVDTICINYSWSGYRDGEYEDYWEQTLSLPIATYFEGGMKSAGSVYDELTSTAAIKRVGTRAYQSGDEDDSSVTTDGANTYYALSSPVTIAIDPPLGMTYKVADYGTEQSLPANTTIAPTTTPLRALIAYTTDFTRDAANIYKNITSMDSIDDLITQLNNKLSTDITKSWDDTSGKWTFSL